LLTGTFLVPLAADVVLVVVGVDVVLLVGEAVVVLVVVNEVDGASRI
jgi:hypothetical protein